MGIWGLFERYDQEDQDNGVVWVANMIYSERYSSVDFVFGSHSGIAAVPPTHPSHGHHYRNHFASAPVDLSAPLISVSRHGYFASCSYS